VSLKIARHYRGLLFQSGESQATRSRAAQDPVPQFFNIPGYQYRTTKRYPPDNLMINSDRVIAAMRNYWNNIPSYTVPKLRPDLGTGASAATSISVADHYSVYKYDAATGTYTKTEQSHLYRDASLGQPLRIEMLITLHTRVSLLDVGDGHGAHIHDYDIDSSGGATFYYKGQRYEVSEQRPAAGLHTAQRQGRDVATRPRLDRHRQLDGGLPPPASGVGGP
jgi:hypothetical protein